LILDSSLRKSSLKNFSKNINNFLYIKLKLLNRNIFIINILLNIRNSLSFIKTLILIKKALDFVYNKFIINLSKNINIFIFLNYI
jgi:hypothetical protein